MKFASVDSSVFYSEAGIAERNEWPFKNMSIGDCVEFCESDAKQAQKYAHTYADKSSPKVKFKTKKTRSGKMLIMRVL